MLRGFFTADSGASTGAATADPPKAETPPEPSAADEKKFTQAELEQQIKERLARQQRQFDAQQRDAQAALEAKQLEEQAEWQKLANRRADEIRDLKPRAALAENYEKGVRALLDVLTADQPVNILTLLEKLPLPDQLDWLIANAGTLKPQAATGSTNINAYGRSAPAPALTDEEYKAKKRASGQYI